MGQAGWAAHLLEGCQLLCLLIRHAALRGLLRLRNVPQEFGLLLVQRLVLALRVGGGWASARWAGGRWGRTGAAAESGR